MNNEEFIAQSTEAPTGTLDREELELTVKTLSELQRDDKKSFIDDGKFYQVRDYLQHLFAGMPPVKFLDDLLSYYHGMERHIEKDVLPEILQRAGLHAVTTASGSEVEIKKITTATLVDENEFAAWAEKNGCADILKYKFSIRKGEDIAAVRAKLAELGTNYVEGLDKSGLPQSLGKLARDLMADGKPLPPPTALAVSIFEEARLK
jgi:hypothetical protein